MDRPGPYYVSHSARGGRTFLTRDPRSPLGSRVCNIPVQTDGLNTHRATEELAHQLAASPEALAACEALLAGDHELARDLARWATYRAEGHEGGPGDLILKYGLNGPIHRHEPHGLNCPCHRCSPPSTARHACRAEAEEAEWENLLALVDEAA